MNHGEMYSLSQQSLLVRLILWAGEGNNSVCSAVTVFIVVLIADDDSIILLITFIIIHYTRGSLTISPSRPLLM